MELMIQMKWSFLKNQAYVNNIRNVHTVCCCIQNCIRFTDRITWLTSFCYFRWNMRLDEASPADSVRGHCFYLYPHSPSYSCLHLLLHHHCPLPCSYCSLSDICADNADFNSGLMSLSPSASCSSPFSCFYLQSTGFSLERFHSSSLDVTFGRNNVSILCKQRGMKVAHRFEFFEASCCKVCAEHTTRCF